MPTVLIATRLLWSSVVPAATVEKYASDKAELALGGSSEKQISKEHIFLGSKVSTHKLGRLRGTVFVSQSQGPQYVV